MEPAARGQIEKQIGLVDALAAGGATEPRELGAAIGELGRLYHAYGLESAAADCYGEAERLDPDDARWPYYRGFLHQVRGDAGVAAEAFERARRLAPEDPAALVRLARARLELDELEAAAALFRESLESHPSTAAAAQAGLARIAAGRGRHAEAVERYRAALALQPAATRLHYPLALALKELGDTTGAEQHLALRGDAAVAFPDPLAEAIDRQAVGAALHVNRAGIALAEGRHEAAVEEYRLALAADPGNATARGELGMLLAAGGDLAGARAELEEARRLEPHNPAHLEALARVVAAGGDEAAALPLFREAVALDPRRAAGHLQLAAALARSGSYAEAESSYDRALDLDPGSTTGRLGRAEVLLELGRTREAVPDLEAVLRTEPENGRASIRLAEARQQLGEAEAALARFENALTSELEPRERAAALLGSANLLAARGELAQAVERYREALELVPGPVGAELRLAGALAALGRWPEARRRLESALARHPRETAVANALARLLASSPDPASRDGDRAVELALALMTAEKSPAHAETLAMALAAAGRFGEAVEWQRELLAQARAAGAPPALLARLESNLALYEAGAPCCAAPGSG